MPVNQTKLADYAQRLVSGALFGLTIYGTVNMGLLFHGRRERLRAIEQEMRERGFQPNTDHITESFQGLKSGDSANMRRRHGLIIDERFSADKLPQNTESNLRAFDLEV
ncbi:hypothetical protein PYCC9005_002906 [Savitreella phatthalungensis]